MNDFIKAINKYALLLIAHMLFGIPWFYIRFLIFDKYPQDSLVDLIPTIIDYLIRIIVIVLLIFDFRKFNLKNVVIACISALFFPLLGVVIFSIMYLIHNKERSQRSKN